MAKDQDLDLLDRLLDLHSPDPETAKDLDDIRAAFKRLGKMIIKKTARTPDRTVALRKLHEATQAAIFARVAPVNEEPVTPAAPTKPAAKPTPVPAKSAAKSASDKAG